MSKTLPYTTTKAGFLKIYASSIPAGTGVFSVYVTTTGAKDFYYVEHQRSDGVNAGTYVTHFLPKGTVINSITVKNTSTATTYGVRLLQLELNK